MKKSLRKHYCIYHFLFLSLLGTLVVMASCGNSDKDKLETEGPSFFDEIYSDGILTARLDVNMDSIMYYKDDEPDKEMKGAFAIQLQDSTLEIPVEVRTRGVTRKKMCSFPPLRVQIKKDAAREHDWADFRNYKLVTHCSDSLREDELLFREYLVYKMYAKLTDYSLRAQLLDMQYIFPRDTLRRYAVLLENEEGMCSRLGLSELDIAKTKLTSINFDQYKRFVLFQYMVGNTDWNLGTGHNTKYVVPLDSKTPIVIPYDFDYSGLVNAPYATPYETLPITNVRQRYLMYRGKKEDDFSAIRDEFLGLKSEWVGMIEEFPLLSDESKADVLGFIDEFFTILEQPDWKDRMFPS